MPRLKNLFFTLVLFLFAAGVFETAGRLFFSAHPHLEKVRLMARGEIPPLPAFQMSIGQAYLLYVPTPNFTNENGLQHNAHGYRGKLVPLRRTPGVLRVLSLGGSTVYGWDVPRPEDSYPAQLEKWLNEHLPPSVQSVEVINGGLPFGTTAEMLTHYHFKYHYYKPDLVIIEAGGNDGKALVAPFYQPDYSHWRQPLQLPAQPSRFMRKLMRSRFISIIAIPLFYGLHPEENTILRDSTVPPITQWYEPKEEIPEDEIGVKHDLETLISEITADGAKVLLTPFRPAPPGYEDELKEAVALNEKIIREMAASKNLGFAPFPAETISSGNWTDDCHLNEEGNKQKAHYLADYVAKLLFA